ncbi:hypothetical protein [Actinophytocola sp.]|uniref:hypothetical protein n=1 Tax=Actinophytocola sp. TaxID=1872138 RepID=UPI002ED3C823
MSADPPRHLLDTSDVDPSTQPPLCDEQEFTELVRQMVNEAAPRLFAVVQEYGERVDAHVAGWGLWFGDRAVAVDVDGGMRIARSVESAMRLFRDGPYITSRLWWAGPVPAHHSGLRQHDE